MIRAVLVHRTATDDESAIEAMRERAETLARHVDDLAIVDADQWSAAAWPELERRFPGAVVIVDGDLDLLARVAPDASRAGHRVLWSVDAEPTDDTAERASVLAEGALVASSAWFPRRTGIRTWVVRERALPGASERALVWPPGPDAWANRVVQAVQGLGETSRAPAPAASAPIAVAPSEVAPSAMTPARPRATVRRSSGMPVVSRASPTAIVYVALVVVGIVALLAGRTGLGSDGDGDVARVRPVSEATESVDSRGDSTELSDEPDERRETKGSSSEDGNRGRPSGTRSGSSVTRPSRSSRAPSGSRVGGTSSSPASVPATTPAATSPPATSPPTTSPPVMTTPTTRPPVTTTPTTTPPTTSPPVTTTPSTTPPSTTPTFPPPLLPRLPRLPDPIF